MNILIVENEIYLAHSIASRLRELNHTCDICVAIDDTAQDINYDTVLLSSNIITHDVQSVIQRFKQSIIILLVSYVSNDTVSVPLSLGAKDYILKPFVVDELIKKICHYKDYELAKKKLQGYEQYLSHIFADSQSEFNEDNVQLPIFVSASFQKDTDAFAYKYSIKRDRSIDFLSLKQKYAMKKLENLDSDTLTYITGFHSLKNTDKELFFGYIKDKKVIVSNSRQYDTNGYTCIEIGCKDNIFEELEILTIENYVKHVIRTCEDKLTDTELSRRLGISRKSIWEKRKKYSMQKKRN